MTKRAIIIGASSGIGMEIARRLATDGWSLGLAARRKEHLTTMIEEFKGAASDGQKFFIERIDVKDNHAVDCLFRLIETLGGIDLYIHSAGVGWKNYNLEEDIELETIETNAYGFTQMVGAIFRYMSNNGGGHIAVISSIAGTKGLGPAPAYSATKVFQARYIEALEQLSANKRLNISFTDCRPGFVATDLINGGAGYPLLMKPDKVAKTIVSSIYKRRHVVVIDWKWHIITSLWRCIPRWLWRQFNLTRD